MFNSPILDVTIGLVFVFLLYSLMVTSINETIASTFALRARMLKNAIAERMLSDISNDGRWKSIWMGFVSFFAETIKIFSGWQGKPKGKKLGDKFYDHPLIKNYSSSRIYSMPSYIPKNNFSTVLVDVLKQEFDYRKKEIANFKLTHSTSFDTEESILRQLDYSPDIVKVKEIVDHYGRHYSNGEASIPRPIIDKEAWDVIQMHLNNSEYNIEKFTLYVEKWFDDTMDRVGGWYKRQTQFILFCLGMLIAVMFNVDTIALANKLSTNTDARKILVEDAISFQERYGEIPPSNVPASPATPTNTDSLEDDTLKSDSLALVSYQQKIDTILKFKRKEIDNINTILAIGWGDYGMKRDSAMVLAMYFQKCNCKDSTDTPAARQKILEGLYKNSWWKYKVSYVMSESFHGRRLIGFALTAFAISLGAPFWFDMLNKVIKVRSTGTKVDGPTISSETKTTSGNSAPIIINNQLTEEAQG